MIIVTRITLETNADDRQSTTVTFDVVTFSGEKLFDLRQSDLARRTNGLVEQFVGHFQMGHRMATGMLLRLSSIFKTVSTQVIIGALQTSIPIAVDLGGLASFARDEMDVV